MLFFKYFIIVLVNINLLFIYLLFFLIAYVEVNYITVCNNLYASCNQNKHSFIGWKCKCKNLQISIIEVSTV